MFPPIFTLVSNDHDVQVAFGTNPVRVFPFGSAPEKPTLPYSVWQIIGGAPENYVGNLPDMDTFLIQVDVYAKTASSARSSAEALRDALEEKAYIVAWRGESKDLTTQHYRYSFDINFFTAR